MKRQIGGLILAAIMAVCLALPLAVSVQAASSANTWTAEECSKVNGDFLNGNCYAKPADIDVSVAIGGVQKTTLANYLSAAYRIAIGAAAVLAVVMIMIGGFRYIAAAGGKDVSGAKDMIKNAIIGLVLTILAFTLLQTVNPSIVTLDLPRAKMVKADYLKQLAATSSAGMIGGPCYTKKDKEACGKACVDAGLGDKAYCECKVIDGGIWSDFAKFSTIAAVGAVGGAVGVEAGALNALKQVGSASLKVVTRLGRYAVSSVGNFFKTAAVGTAITTGAVFGIAAASSDDDGELGVCLPLALNSVEPGGTCFIEESNCVKGAWCIPINTNPSFGMCVSGKAGTACSTDKNTQSCNQNLNCCEVEYGLGTCQLDCDKRALDANCTSDDQCASGKCAIKAGKQSTVCVGSAIGVFCTGNSDCDKVGSGYYCPRASMDVGPSVEQTSETYKAFEKCREQEGSGSSCCLNSDCLSGTCSATARCYLKVENGQYKIDNNGTCK